MIPPLPVSLRARLLSCTHTPRSRSLRGAERQEHAGAVPDQICCPPGARPKARGERRAQHCSPALRARGDAADDGTRTLPSTANSHSHSQALRETPRCFSSERSFIGCDRCSQKQPPPNRIHIFNTELIAMGPPYLPTDTSSKGTIMLSSCLFTLQL